MEIPFQPSGWASKVRQLIAAEDGCTVERAVETVTLQYLRAGDYRPLLDSVRRGHTHGPQVKALLAAMLDRQQHHSRNSLSPEYEFWFEFPRKKGRPKKLQIADHFFYSLRRGVQALAEGREPSRMFWHYFLAALDPDHRSIIERGIKDAFPWRAKIQHVQRGKGRRCDPELVMRDKVLAWMVQQRIDQGGKYDWAIADTIEAIERDARKERWQGRKITTRTVRDAYDHNSKKLK
jgi:hypothetical protein